MTEEIRIPPALPGLLKSACYPHRSEIGDFFTGRFLEKFGDKVLVVVFYGSRLSSITARPDSFSDFFVITDGYRGLHDKRRYEILSYILPPSVFYINTDKTTDTAVEQERNFGACKYNLISMEHFSRWTSERMKDMYIAGRFGKFIGICWVKDAAVLDQFVECCARAMAIMQRHVLALLPESFTFEQYVRACIKVSYTCELRPIEPDKVRELYESATEFYNNVYALFLEEHVQARRLIKNEDVYVRSVTAKQLQKDTSATRRMSRRSRRRSFLRLFKHTVTVENWLELVLKKIERARGVRIELTERERRWPFIFGWGRFFALIRKGHLK